VALCKDLESVHKRSGGQYCTCNYVRISNLQENEGDSKSFSYGTLSFLEGKYGKHSFVLL
jgi:hypothetical protein